MPFFYLLECSDGSYYAGSTIELSQRVIQHEAGFGARYTKSRRPVKLVYYEEYERVEEAFVREKQVQGWKRKKKQALIAGQHQMLPVLSRTSGR